MSNKKMVIVIPSYNNINWCEKNINSVLSQKYNNFRVIYTDDSSSDGTSKRVAELTKDKDNFELIQNSERMGALANLYNMIHSCDDDEVIVTLDGDDWLAHDNVLSRVNREYQDPNVWITWGQYKDHPQGGTGCSQAIPQHVIQSNSYRRYRWCTSHLRTFYAGLFKKIKKEDLMHDNKFYSVAWDLAFMMPMLEMSCGKGRFISDILYMYNHENPIQDYKKDIKLQQHMEMIIRSKSAYKKINRL